MQRLFILGRVGFRRNLIYLSNHEASVFAVHHAVKKSSQFYVHLKEIGSSYLEV